MKCTVKKGRPETVACDLVAIACFERPDDARGKKRPGLLTYADGGTALDAALEGALADQIEREHFEGERHSHRLLFTAGRIPARFILILGLGKKSECTLATLREVGAQLTRAAHEVGATSAALVLERGEWAGADAPARGRAIVEGAHLGGYRFLAYRTNDKLHRKELAALTLLYTGAPKPVEQAAAPGRIVTEATNAARDLVNTPPADATPRIIARTAKRIAKQRKLRCTVWGTEAIRKARMHCLLAVARGSAEPPTFTTLVYKPKKRARGKVALVGKGVTFDSGGISLKPPRSMETMKEDMAGAATVLAAMAAIAQLAPPVEVHAFLPAAENLPDGKALRPGDIITARNGKTIEILSTDAEGRLLLADALALAADKGFDAIVDLATLTGGAAYVAGELFTPAMGTDRRLVERLTKAGEAAGEPMIALPLVEEYMKGYTSGIADLNNTGKGKAQTILGGLFLKEFVGETPWAHLDIAASAWTTEELPLSGKGATGAMVRTLVEFVTAFRKGSVG